MTDHGVLKFEEPVKPGRQDCPVGKAHSREEMGLDPVLQREDYAPRRLRPIERGKRGRKVGRFDAADGKIGPAGKLVRSDAPQRC